MINLISDGLVTLVALLHVYFLILEMFLWTKPFGRKTFGMTVEQAKSTKVLAANQGLYNGFLAAGLAWGMMQPSIEDGTPIKVFFLSCVIIAGIYGAKTVSKKILLVQALPAVLALGSLFLQN